MLVYELSGCGFESLHSHIFITLFNIISKSSSAAGHTGHWPVKELVTLAF